MAALAAIDSPRSSSAALRLLPHAEKLHDAGTTARTPLQAPVDDPAPTSRLVDAGSCGAGSARQYEGAPAVAEAFAGATTASAVGGAAGPAAGGASGTAIAAASTGTAVAGAAAVAPFPENPLAFLYQGKYYREVFGAGGVDVDDRHSVEQRSIRGVLRHLQDEGRPHWGVASVDARRVDPVRDADLVAVDPGAMWFVDVRGRAPRADIESIPVVINRDGTTYVDPRLRG